MNRRKCATCIHWDRDDMRCYAANPGISTPAYPGFDEDDPRMMMPLDCWDEMDEEAKSELALAYREGCFNEIRHCGDSECGHYDSCQMMCDLDFDDAVEGEECRHGLEIEDREEEYEWVDDGWEGEGARVKRSRSAYDLVDYLIAYIIWAEWRGFHGTAAMAIYHLDQLKREGRYRA